MKTSSRLYILTLIYVSWVILWAISRWLFQDRFWLLALINTMAEYLFIPLPFLFLIAIYRKNKHALATLLIPLGLYFVFWGRQFLPNLPNQAIQDAGQIEVMTYNIWVSNRSSQLIVESVLGESPDLIGFQELSKHNIPILQSRLRQEYPFDTFASFSGARSDVGLVSRYPILSVERFSFPPEERAMHAMIDWKGQNVHVFIVHLTANNLFQYPDTNIPELATKRFGQRAYQVQRIAEELAGIEEPVILLCDCNLTDTSEAYHTLSSRLNDSFKMSGWGIGHTLLTPTFSTPYMRIDYIWYSSDFTAVSSHVGENKSSDHLPVVSVLALPGDPTK
jgi:vancomycin resistance protein VanJ